MKTLGYIVTKSKVSATPPFIKVVSDLNSCENGKPRLIIGLNNAKSYTDKFSILNKRLDDTTYWTFGKTEKRTINESDIRKFIDIVLEDNIKNIRYYYVNVMTLPYTKAKNLIAILNSTSPKHIYICNDMIYVYHDGYVLGISVKIAEYCGIKREKIFEKLKSCNNCAISDDEQKINTYIKYIIKEKKYLMPYFMSLQEN